MKLSFAFFVPVLLILTPLSPVFGDEPLWARFRGPNGSGVSDAANIPVNWTEQDYNWTVDLPGIGFSSPVIWEERIFLTSTIEKDAVMIVLCLSTTDGSIRWKTKFKAKPHPKFKANIDASATPVVDKDRVTIVWATPDEHVVIALDQREGRELWRRDLGPFVAEDGCGASPVLAGDAVVVINDQDEGGTSSILALDRETGKTIWRRERVSKKATFSTPCLFEPKGGRPQLILLSCAHGITSLDPRTGKKNWELADVFQVRTTGSPLVVSDMIFGTNGAGTSGKYLVAARAGIPEQNVRPEVLYQITKSVPYVITPVAKWPLVFLWTDGGVVTCIDGPTGKVYWRERVGGKYLGSPVRAGDRIYCISQSGEVVVLAAANQFKEIARVELGEQSNSTPAVSNGVIYLRTFSKLISLGGRTP